MPNAPEGGHQHGSMYRFRELLATWWHHRAVFLISVAITVVSLGVYIFTFMGDRNTPLFDFLKRFEYSTLDTRFRYRPAKYTPPDPRIVVVAIDQRSQEALGKWPFSRKYFARMLDALREDGARVVSFDVTFDKPDVTAAPVRELWRRLEERKKSGGQVDPQLEAQIREVAREYDADSQFGESIRKFGPVVLGNFYMSADEVRGIDDATLDKYATMVQWYALSRRAIHPGTGKQDFETLLKNYEFHGMLYNATIANSPELANTDNDNAHQTAVRFVIAPA